MPRLALSSLVIAAVVLAAPTLAAAQGKAPREIRKQNGSNGTKQNSTKQHVPNSSKSYQGGKQEPSAKVTGTNAGPIFVNGALDVPGAPKDVDTIPSKFSERTAADDQLPIAAYALRHLTAEQRNEIRDAADGGRDTPASGSRALGGYAVVGSELPVGMPLDELRPLPAELVSKMPELRGFAFTWSEGKLLLVDADNNMVIGVFEK